MHDCSSSCLAVGCSPPSPGPISSSISTAPLRAAASRGRRAAAPTPRRGSSGARTRTGSPRRGPYPSAAALPPRAASLPSVPCRPLPRPPPAPPRPTPWPGSRAWTCRPRRSPTSPRAMEQGRLTSVRLVQAYLDRVAAYDGPTNSVLVLDDRALEVAAERDRERAAARSAARCTASRCCSRTTSAPSASRPPPARSRSRARPARRRRPHGAPARGRRRGPRQDEPVGVRELGRPTHAQRLLEPRRPGAGRLHARRPQRLVVGLGRRRLAGAAAGTLGTETSARSCRPATSTGWSASSPPAAWSAATGVVPLAEGFDTAGPMTRTVARRRRAAVGVAGRTRPTRRRRGRTRHCRPAATTRRGSRTRRSRGSGSPTAPSAAAALPVESRALYAQALDDLRGLGAVLVETDGWRAPSVDVSMLELIPPTSTLPRRLAAARGADAAERGAHPRRRRRLQRPAPGADAVRAGPAAAVAGGHRPTARPRRPPPRPSAPRRPPPSTAGSATRGVEAVVAPGPQYARRRRGRGPPDRHRADGPRHRRAPRRAVVPRHRLERARAAPAYAAAYERATARRVPPPRHRGPTRSAAAELR